MFLWKSGIFRDKVDNDDNRDGKTWKFERQKYYSQGLCRISSVVSFLFKTE